MLLLKHPNQPRGDTATPLPISPSACRIIPRASTAHPSISKTLTRAPAFLPSPASPSLTGSASSALSLAPIHTPVCQLLSAALSLPHSLPFSCFPPRVPTRAPRYTHLPAPLRTDGQLRRLSLDLAQPAPRAACKENQIICHMRAAKAARVEVAGCCPALIAEEPDLGRTAWLATQPDRVI